MQKKRFKFVVLICCFMLSQILRYGVSTSYRLLTCFKSQSCMFELLLILHTAVRTGSDLKTAAATDFLKLFSQSMRPPLTLLAARLAKSMARSQDKKGPTENSFKPKAAWESTPRKTIW